MGFDWCFIDAEHTPMGPDLLTDIIKTINYYSEGSMASVVRLPTHGHEWIAWALDAGAAAIVLPHNYGYTDGVPEGSSLLNMWSTNAAIIMQIESGEGAKNAERICCVEGVDAIMIGTGDLRLSMRLPFGFDGPEPEFQEAVKNIEEAAARHNLPLAGFALGPPAVKAKLKKGYKLLMVSNDMTSLTAGQSANLAAARSAVTDSKKVEEKKSFVGKAENVIVAKVAARAMAGQ
ncbi:hypothetical protein FRB98_004429 [Tulasnella sp. 332]|nr:hypothetical protein FRB98_004429 [Tulasnella sp. 332]